MRQVATQQKTTNPDTAGGAVAAQGSGAAPATQSPPATEPQHDPIADAERELAFKARFASNLISGASRPLALRDACATRWSQIT
jgi:type IV secretion system protein TrbI